MKMFGISIWPKTSAAAKDALNEVEEARERLSKASEDLRRVVADVLHHNENLRGDRVKGSSE